MNTTNPLLCTYGALVQSLPGPIAPGSSPRIGLCNFPDELKDRFLDLRWLSADSRSARTLVAAAAQPRGAFFVLPVETDGQVHVLAGRIRPRPEHGEGLPGRRFTQMNLYLFPAADWATQAPQLVAGIGRWLLAEPILSDHAQRRRQQQNMLGRIDDWRSRQLPLDDDSPLPAEDSPVDRLLRLIETGSPGAIRGWTELAGKGPAEQEAHFLVAIAQLLYLLPTQSRTLLSFSFGLARPHPWFGLQWIPGLSEQANDPEVAASSLLTDWRNIHALETIEDWRKSLRRYQQHSNDGTAAGAFSADDARAMLSKSFAYYRNNTAFASLLHYLRDGGSRPPLDAQPDRFRALTLVLIAAIVAAFPSREQPALIVRALGLLRVTVGPDWRRIWLGLLQSPAEPGPLETDIERCLSLIMDWLQQADETLPTWAGGTRSADVAASLRLLGAFSPDTDPDHPDFGRIDDFEAFVKLDACVTHYAARDDYVTSDDDLPDRIETRAYAKRLIELSGRSEALLIADPIQLLAIAASNPGILKMSPSATDATRELLAVLAGSEQALILRGPAADLLQQVFAMDSGDHDTRTNPRVLEKVAAYLGRADALQAPGREVWHTELSDRIERYSDALDAVDDAMATSEHKADDTWFYHLLGRLLGADEDELVLDLITRHQQLQGDDRDTRQSALMALLALLGSLHPIDPETRPTHAALLTALPQGLNRLSEVSDPLFTQYLRTAEALLNTPASLLGLIEASTSLLTKLSRPTAADQEKALQLIQLFDRTENLIDLLDEHPVIADRLLETLMGLLPSWSTLVHPWFPPADDAPLSRSNQALRRFFAERLGYPYCQYFGRIADSQNKASLPLTPDHIHDELIYKLRHTTANTNDTATQRLIARCGVAEWHRDFQMQQKAFFGLGLAEKTVFCNPGELKWGRRDYPITQYALSCLQQWFTQEPQQCIEWIGADIPWVVDFLTAFHQRPSPEDADTPAGTPAPPADLRGYLLKPTKKHPGAFSIHLARHIVAGGLQTADSFLAGLSDDHDANDVFGHKVWLLSTTWEHFDELSDDETAARIERYLFVGTLVQIQSARLRRKDPRRLIGEPCQKALIVPEVARPRIQHLLHQKTYRRHRNAITRTIETIYKSRKRSPDEERIHTAIRSSWGLE